MSKKETFVLDAVLQDVIRDATFSAVLPNGHQIVAFPRRAAERSVFASLKKGSRVRVCMSPYDMSKGVIVSEEAVKDLDS
jgi:translation initiation factor IF-1